MSGIEGCALYWIWVFDRHLSHSFLHSCCGDRSRRCLGMMKEAAEGDAQSVLASIAAAGCSPWFLAHAPLLMVASPRGSAALRAPLPALGGDQVGPPCHYWISG